MITAMRLTSYSTRGSRQHLHVGGEHEMHNIDLPASFSTHWASPKASFALLTGPVRP